MKNITRSSRPVRLSLFVGLLAMLPALGFANDRAAQLLQTTGAISVKNVGPYVEVGTYRIQVSGKLGQPAARLVDGSWVYPNFVVDESNARGTLIVRFHGGTVSELSLVSPVALAAMQASPKKGSETILVASQSSRR